MSTTKEKVERLYKKMNGHANTNSTCRSWMGIVSCYGCEYNTNGEKCSKIEAYENTRLKIKELDPNYKYVGQLKKEGKI